jgi:fermentation-respiration switch protein FrsA (DUF1100 family)
LENYLIFHPLRAADDWEAPPPNADVHDVFLTTATGVRIHGWWCPRPQSAGAVLYFHGNAGNLSHRGHSVQQWLQQFGESVLIVDYPGYGKSEGKPSEAGCYASGDASYDWLLKQQKVNPDGITIYGGSLGGGVAVALAQRRPHRLLVLRSTFTSIPDMAQKIYPWFPVRWFVYTQFDNLGKIGACSGPVFIAHGDCDRIVPYAQGQRLFAAANEPKHFFCLTGCDHNDSVPPDFFAELRRFVAKTESQARGAKDSLSVSEN